MARLLKIISNSRTSSNENITSSLIDESSVKRPSWVSKSWSNSANVDGWTSLSSKTEWIQRNRAVESIAFNSGSTQKRSLHANGTEKKPLSSTSKELQLLTSAVIIKAALLTGSFAECSLLTYASISSSRRTILPSR